MHHSTRDKLVRTAVFGGIMALGLGSAQAALASPAQGQLNVPCDTSALASAISNATGGEILVLAPGCTYWLHYALPDITTNLTIIGGGDTFRRSDDAPSFTIVSVTTNISLDITGVSFVNGGGPEESSGGAIYNDGGTIAIHGGVFRDNNSNDDGGAIYNRSGGLTVNSATFLDNTAAYGGAIETGGYARITHSQFIGNSVTNDTDGYGGAIYNDGHLFLGASTLTGNSSDYIGGALYNDYYALLVYDGLSGNTAEWGGGIYNNDVLTVTYSSIVRNAATQDGGGIYNNDETVNLTGDFIHANQPSNCTPAIAGCHG